MYPSPSSSTGISSTSRVTISFGVSHVCAACAAVAASNMMASGFTRPVVTFFSALQLAGFVAELAEFSAGLAGFAGFAVGFVSFLGPWDWFCGFSGEKLRLPTPCTVSAICSRPWVDMSSSLDKSSTLWF